MEKNGGFMTEYWSGTNPEKENFVKRNRIVAGISEATIVIESAIKGGSLITANLANDYNRDVFAVPGRTSDKLSLGCNNLIKTQKANLLTSAADLIYILNWDIEKTTRSVQKKLFVTLENEEQKILTKITNNLQSGKNIVGNPLIYAGAFRSCVSYASRALWCAGIPNIGIHPFLLHASILTRQLGLYISPQIPTASTF